MRSAAGATAYTAVLCRASRSAIARSYARSRASNAAALRLPMRSPTNSPAATASDAAITMICVCVPAPLHTIAVGAPRATTSAPIIPLVFAPRVMPSLSAIRAPDSVALAPGDHAADDVRMESPDDVAPPARPESAPAAPRQPRRRIPLLGPMRIRKKLILLHTTFSVTLTLLLLLAVRPAVRDVVRLAEMHEAQVAMALLSAEPTRAMTMRIEGVEFARGSVAELGISPAAAADATRRPGESVPDAGPDDASRLVRWRPETGEFLSVTARSVQARETVTTVYALLVAAVLAAYTLIALTLDLVVLPRQVYRPIGVILDADAALREGRRSDELIESVSIPDDELGEIMRSRNQSVTELRRQERALAGALERIEDAATELRRKNHLLENARRNLADQDRLASLGMMSAGIAHELNTPLAVLKGQVERIAADPGRAVPREQADLMLRVVRRLERLSESLLDFARVRPPLRRPVALRTVIDEAWSLVRLDRGRGVGLINAVPADAVVQGDPDRLHQVFVNLLRNAVNAMEEHPLPGGSADDAGAVTVTAEQTERDGASWASVLISDEGPGIDPAVLPRLFEPFASTRMDSHGTGLGLAVSEGIIREHGGVILARNGTPRPGARRPGAVFEVMLPVADPAAFGPGSEPGADGSGIPLGDQEAQRS